MATFSCMHCAREFKSYKGYVTHIGRNCIGGKLYYDTYIGTDIGKCEECKSDTKFLSISKGYGRFCSSKCAGINQGTKDKYNANFLKKYGVCRPMQSPKIKENYQTKYKEKTGYDNPLQNPLIISKIKSIMIYKYNVDHVSKTKMFIGKTRETKKNKYGDENFNNLPKHKLTCLERYGVDNGSKLHSIQDKKEATCLMNNGVRYPLQNSNIFKKWHDKSYKRKDYIFPSGNHVTLQGYEPYALDILIAEGLSESDIIVDNSLMPSFKYNISGKSHKYYPDIFIPNRNLIIEIKSTYTANIDKNLKQKQKSVTDCGYSYELWVIDHKQIINKEIYAAK